ncbi:adenylate/guanylate cyclase domain-containing protein [Fulvivirga lutea]|uniref:Adenylate/guanylate cyclase domain-containing protein n=1 Tax=Fulvivirga lutea TaxID=2810512 RepID=A0A974WJ76_9BACT|nr:adenylate/guanylate cyclase domain-containing protein [Fulvivirga lutea]QSE98768.1 adenylate/guanylate cyclase domain-containing protein [Fulvivirga lutea]
MFNSLSPATKRNIIRILPFGFIWLTLGVIFMFIEYAALGGFDNVSSTAIRVNSQILVFASIAVTILGLLIGTVEVIWLNKAFSNKSFTTKIVYKFAFYIVFLFLVILITFPIAASMELETGIFDKRVWAKYIYYLTSITNLSTFVQMSVSLFACLFYAEISENIGQNVLLNFFTGKYHQPVEEKRVFMFLDMKSSTTIAEQLGHITYFKLLKEYYNTLTHAIIKHGGEVYQYIGDEIVISWPFEKGLQNQNCIRSFLAMKQDLENRSAYFQKTFGVIPTFKVGIHAGLVTTGEIGALKKEIIFTGDVLNTTSRIQGLCNELGVDNLISKELADQLPYTENFSFKSMGTHDLKGKIASLELVAVV